MPPRDVVERDKNRNRDVQGPESGRDSSPPTHQPPGRKPTPPAKTPTRTGLEGSPEVGGSDPGRRGPAPNDDDQRNQATFEEALVGVLGVIAPPVGAFAAGALALRDRLGLDSLQPTRNPNPRRGGGVNEDDREKPKLEPTAAPIAETEPELAAGDVTQVGNRAKRRRLGDQFSVPTRRPGLSSVI